MGLDLGLDLGLFLCVECSRNRRSCCVSYNIVVVQNISVSMYYNGWLGWMDGWMDRVFMYTKDRETPTEKG